MKKSVLFLVAGIIALILVLYAINVFPMPGTDSVVFIPPALFLSKGQGLANPLYYVTTFTDLTHTFRFNYYVPFYSYLLGILSKVHPGIQTIFFFCSLISAAGLLLYAGTVGSYLPQRMGAWAKAAVILSVSYVAIYLLPTVGRPECITVLLVFLVHLLYRRRAAYKPSVYNAAICLLFALILASQIICFYFCFLFFITYELLGSSNIPKTILHNTLRFAAIIGLFCGILAITPNGLVNTISGIRLHIAYVLIRTDRSIPLFFYYWLLAPLNTGFLVFFIMGGIFYAKELVQRFRKLPIINVVLTLGIQLLVVFGIVKFILYAGPTIYNATEFILPLSCYIIANIMLLQGRSKLFYNSIALLTYAAGSFIFLRSILLFADYLNDGKTYSNARAAIAPVLREHQPNVYITQGLWTLCDDLYSLKFYDPGNHKKGDVIIIQQAYHSFPPELAGKYTIIKDWTTTENRKFLGLPLTKHAQGYSFWVCRIN